MFTISTIARAHYAFAIACIYCLQLEKKGKIRSIIRKIIDYGPDIVPINRESTALLNIFHQ